MKVYMSTAMAGISGVVKETVPVEKGAKYECACRILTEEVNAAVDGALSGVVKSVIVMGGHSYGNQI